MGPTLLVRMPSVPPRKSPAGVVDLEHGSAARPSEERDETVGQRDQLLRQSRLLRQPPRSGKFSTVSPSARWESSNAQPCFLKSASPTLPTRPMKSWVAVS